MDMHLRQCISSNIQARCLPWLTASCRLYTYTTMSAHLQGINMQLVQGTTRVSMKKWTHRRRRSACAALGRAPGWTLCCGACWSRACGHVGAASGGCCQPAAPPHRQHCSAVRLAHQTFSNTEQRSRTISSQYAMAGSQRKLVHKCLLDCKCNMRQSNARTRTQTRPALCRRAQGQEPERSQAPVQQTNKTKDTCLANMGSGSSSSDSSGAFLKHSLSTGAC